MSDRAAHAAAQWRRERQDIDPVPMEILGRLAEAASVIGRDYLGPLFVRFGLHPGEFDVLATLRRSGSPYMLSPTALYESAMISSGGMTNRLDRLEKAGLIGRHPHPTDRRGTLVALTPAGLSLIEDLLPRHVENERAVLASLSPADQADLNRLLEKLLAGLPPPPDGGDAPGRHPVSARGKSGKGARP